MKGLTRYLFHGHPLTTERTSNAITSGRNGRRSTVSFVRGSIRSRRRETGISKLSMSRQTDGCAREIFNWWFCPLASSRHGESRPLPKTGIELGNHRFRQDRRFQPYGLHFPPRRLCVRDDPGPKDIPQSVTEASAAAATAAFCFTTARNSLDERRKRKFLWKQMCWGQPPRIGVFICHCGINIGGVVNVPGVAEYARPCPCVAYVEDNLYTCSQDTQDQNERR